MGRLVERGIEKVEVTLEREFENAKQSMMKRVVHAVTMKMWIDKQLEGVNIPTFMIDHKELQYRASVIADKVIDEMIKGNELEQAFDEAWQAVAPALH